jgi:hypothetical protein
MSDLFFLFERQFVLNLWVEPKQTDYEEGDIV